MSDPLEARDAMDSGPSPEGVPIGPGQLDQIDENLHLGWSWHRYRYVYRRLSHPRILVAGCGTGLDALGAATINPGASVVGVEDSPRALELARARAERTPRAVEFRQHDARQRLPVDLGPFDFIICRDLIDRTDNPAAVLENLARSADPRALLLLTFPSRAARHAARQFRRAVQAIAPPDASLAERAELGMQLFRALRPEHPFKRFEAATSGHPNPGRDRLITAYLEPRARDWDLEDGAAALRQAGWKFLYAAGGRPWDPGPVFDPAAIPDDLRERIAAMDEARRATLVDVLDPAIHLSEHRLYACLDDFEPHLPRWPEEIEANPATLDRLIPHRTGLAEPLDPPTASPTPGQPVMYRVVSGRMGPLDARSDALLRAVDGRQTCSALDRLARGQSVTAAGSAARHPWLNLANHGFVLLESTDPRQTVDCVHLGPVRDRLDCACPRKWIRACDRHTYCSVDSVQPSDLAYPAWEAARSRLGGAPPVSCSECADYSPEEEIPAEGA